MSTFNPMQKRDALGRWESEHKADYGVELGQSPHAFDPDNPWGEGDGTVLTRTVMREDLSSVGEAEGVQLYRDLPEGAVVALVPYEDGDGSPASAPLLQVDSSGEGTHLALTDVTGARPDIKIGWDQASLERTRGGTVIVRDLSSGELLYCLRPMGGCYCQQAEDADGETFLSAREQAIKDETSAEALASWVASPLAMDRLCAAQNPHLPPDCLDTLSRDKVAVVREAVASHPATPGPTLARLSRDADHMVRVHTARNKSTPAQELDRLFADLSTHGGITNSYIECAVASNPSTPPQTLLRILHGGGGGAQWVLENPSTPESTLRWAYETARAQRKDASIEGPGGIDYETVYGMLEVNPALPKDIARPVARGARRDQRAAKRERRREDRRVLYVGGPGPVTRWLRRTFVGRLAARLFPAD